MTTITCRYCQKFQDSELRETSRNPQGKVIHQIRYCPSFDDMRSRDDPKCKDFQLVSWFWCDANEYQLDIVCCTHRQNNPSILWKKCSSCKQKFVIREMTKPALKKKGNDKPLLLKKRRTV